MLPVPDEAAVTVRTDPAAGPIAAMVLPSGIKVQTVLDGTIRSQIDAAVARLKPGEAGGLVVHTAWSPKKGAELAASFVVRKGDHLTFVSSAGWDPNNGAWAAGDLAFSFGGRHGD